MKFNLSSRVALVIIAAMFILPLVLAWLMLSGAVDYKPGPIQNLGELVQPPVLVDWESLLVPVRAEMETPSSETPVSFRNHWVVLHAVPVPCPTPCLEEIAGIRQVHKASGRNQSRIRIALLLQDASQAESVNGLRNIYQLFQLVESPDGAIQPILEEIASRYSTTASGSSYLIDPIGNIMMFYGAGSDPNKLKKDLKRLLTWSRLDKQQ